MKIPKTRFRLRPSRFVPVALLLVAAVATACSGHDKREEPVDESPECNAYVAAYRTCVGRLGSSAIARDRAEVLRGRLTAAMRESKGRAALAQTCSGAMTQLTAACR